MTRDPDDLLTVAEARRVLRCGRSWLYEHADEIGHVRLGTRLRFRRSDLEAYAARNYMPPKGLRVVDAPKRVGRTLTLPNRLNPLTGVRYGEIAR